MDVSRPDATGAAYPPEPWDLHGRSVLSVFLVPAAEAPPAPVGVRPLRLFGRVVVAAAWVAYTEPSPLTYGELMTTVLVREGWRPRAHITHIWVDSPASMAGGRELWAIPKDLADFTLDDAAAAASAYAMSIDGTEVARTRLGRVRALPLPARLAFRLAQDGAVHRRPGLTVSPVRLRTPLGLARATWHVAPAGPIGFLTGRRPLLTLVARRFRMRFGS
ncbi:hypothetical protein J2S59_001485 [Nocardioides massiliensis]|uniref:Acetoacetate decarboxylase n=2 Tax=Nocardioides massiliensis TaxID=1325935 RepID=A0ABT9NMN2_9ACTN|nr:acetoacetate decarboxylase family protein [Nocardioides massiliensis]MDP9821676.1 hypothetical protein [Nocardioides massiliensis]